MHATHLGGIQKEITIGTESGNPTEVPDSRCHGEYLSQVRCNRSATGSDSVGVLTVLGVGQDARGCPHQIPGALILEFVVLSHSVLKNTQGHASPSAVWKIILEQTLGVSDQELGWTTWKRVRHWLRDTILAVGRAGKDEFNRETIFRTRFRCQIERTVLSFEWELSTRRPRNLPTITIAIQAVPSPVPPQHEPPVGVHGRQQTGRKAVHGLRPEQIELVSQ
jgi:hypothetical protein